MKLLKLSSDNPKFKTLNFNDGLNILAGLQLTSSEKKTYNGIGKSFSLNLIHLLLGAKLDKTKQKEKKIYDFLAAYGVFALEFSHNSVSYKIEKDFSETHFLIDGNKVTQTDYPSKLRDIIIGSKFDQNVSFKQILNAFARRYGSTYYADIVTQQGRPVTDFYQMYANLSLLGIDTKLVKEKSQVKDKLNKLDQARKVVEGYESLLEESNVNDLKDELDSLIKNKNDFVIAENYDKYKRDADDATVEINKIRNSIHFIRNKLSRKYESIEQSKIIDIDLNKVKDVYEEAKFFFQDKVTVRLNQAEEFHVKLMESRINRLKSEIDYLNASSKVLTHDLEFKEKYRDLILKGLDSKGALEEYNSINERIRTIDAEVQELEKYKTILEGFKNDEVDLELKNAKIKADSIKYLNKEKKYLSTIESKFRVLVKRFYKNHGGSFKVTTTKDAKYLFNIDVHVPRDGSQGINEVKIFCYDFLLYELNTDLLNFIAHDGCIFSEMDPRQKSMILKVALEYIHKNNLQYFINIGQASLEEILDEKEKLNILTNEEKSEIKNSVILKLYDKDPKEWLFGTSFG